MPTYPLPTPTPCPHAQPRNALKTHETCTQYNMLKIARQLFMWTGDVYYADHYERAMVNGMWGVARLPADELPEVCVRVCLWRCKTSVSVLKLCMRWFCLSCLLGTGRGLGRLQTALL